MPLLDQRPGDGAALAPGVLDGVRADGAEVGGDLVGQHLLEAEAEQVRSVAAVRPRDDVAAEAGRAARPAVAGRAAVGQPGADGLVHLDVSRAVAAQRSVALEARELALEDLAAAPDRARGIARDDVEGRVWRHHVAAARADLLLVRLRDALVGGIRRQCAVRKLGEQGHGDHRGKPDAPDRTHSASSGSAFALSSVKRSPEAGPCISLPRLLLQSRSRRPLVSSTRPRELEGSPEEQTSGRRSVDQVPQPGSPRIRLRRGKPGCAPTGHAAGVGQVRPGGSLPWV